MQWSPVEKSRLIEMIEKVVPASMPSLFSAKTSEALCSKLPFYTSFMLYRITNHACLPAFSMDFLSDGNIFSYMDGTINPVYQVNATGDLVLNENNILDYMAFHVHYVPGPEGEILLIDSRKNVLPTGFMDIDRHRDMLYSNRSVKVSYDNEKKIYIIRVPMYYGGALVRAVINIDLMGHLDIAEYQMLLKGSFEDTENSAPQFGSE
jgi:hypothetical protein